MPPLTRSSRLRYPLPRKARGLPSPPSWSVHADSLTGRAPFVLCERPCDPFDGAADDFHNRGNGTDDWNPSRTHSIEEVPIALGFLVVTDGDFEQSIFGGANYGRDCDSIAGMAGSIAGALHGAKALRDEWIHRVNETNR